MNKEKWVFLDLDGTLIDSLDEMFKIYMKFLESHGIKGTYAEFEKLNGPSLNQIVKYLKNKYNFKESTEFLLKKYSQMIEDKFSKIQPINGSEGFLKNLKENNIHSALVTSSSKALTNSFLKKKNWENYFDIIVCGDDVKKSKPEPDIYFQCLKKSNTDKKNVIVLEDSENGIESAKRAGLRYFATHGRLTKFNELFSKIKNEFEKEKYEL